MRMSLTGTRRFAAPLAIATLVSFAATLVPPQLARADVTDATAPIGNGAGGAGTMGGPPPPANSPDALATVNLSTGAAESSFPFHLETARGEAQPSLALVYDSSNGVGLCRQRLDAQHIVDCAQGNDRYAGVC